ncbi:MAG: hypothetical protein CMA52_00620 [Euryarchaeota archaeon]|jgi:uncharacterized protein (TIGR02246 family)|nr:hypothetical protein [Euryarchaeota archaeon]MDP7608034.1 ketosteroid isomerase family protein [Candidatus Poseidoniia archaeon]HJP44357.1 ketosteroid isomerase family protein [Candidatus Poseidoniia archaeon]
MSALTASDLLQEWVNAVQSGDPRQVTGLYAQDGLLLGTFSDWECVGSGPILEYFENFLKSAVEVEIITESPVSDKTSAFNTGLYNFTLEGKTQKARFTFVFVKNDSGYGSSLLEPARGRERQRDRRLRRWKIKSHHSSLVPESA